MYSISFMVYFSDSQNNFCFSWCSFTSFTLQATENASKAICYSDMDSDTSNNTVYHLVNMDKYKAYGFL